MKYLVLIALVFNAAFALAGSKLEAWKNGEEIRFVERDSMGKFMRSGVLTLENWRNTDDRSEWIARHSDGTLVTGYKGYLEKFKVKGMKKEQTRLVIRNKAGALVTWMAMDEFLTSGFEAMDVDRDGKNETVFVTRYNGKFVNWAKAHLESWANMELPVLVVRDTQDSRNNGKILAWIAGELMSNGVVAYRDPETGRFVSTNL